MPTDGHEVVFKWPHTEPNEVILSGTFNDWARTFHLTKGLDGFSGSVTVPWDSKTVYKFIVDGAWVVRDDQPTELDHEGNTNNVYTAPPDPSLNVTSSTKSNDSAVISSTDVTSEAQVSQQQANDKHLALEPPSRPASTSSFPQLVSDFADTVAARDGTSGAFDYVASGLGKAIHSVVGLDPINSDQIAIPTPLPTAEKVSSEFNSPISAIPSGTPLSAHELAPQLPQVPAIDDANSEPQLVSKKGEVAPEVPVQILPVNAPEHITTPQPPSPSPAVTADNVDSKSRKEDEQPSTHGILPVVNGTGSSREEINVQEKAEETSLPADSADPAPSDAGPPRPSTEPYKGFITTSEVEEGRPETTEPLEGAGDDMRATTTIPLTEPAIPPADALGVTNPYLNDKQSLVSEPNEPSAAQVANVEPPQGDTVDTPQVETPNSDLNPASVLAPEQTANASTPPTIDTPQVNTPNSDLNPASVLVQEETPAGQVVDAPRPSTGVTGSSEHIGQAPAQGTESLHTMILVENIDQVKKLAPGGPQASKVPFTEKGEDVVAPVVASVTSLEVSQSEESKPMSTTVNDKPVPSLPTPLPELTSERQAAQTEAVKPAVNGHTKEDKTQQPERPSTPPKAFPTKEAFPSTGDSSSPSASPSSSKTGTAATRKKRQSIFGKLKHLFDHDKEKEKAKFKK